MPLAQAILFEQGPAFVSLTLDEWANSHGITLVIIWLGSPVKNCFTESPSRKRQDACLNLHHFATLAEAREPSSGGRRGATASGHTVTWGSYPCGLRGAPHLRGGALLNAEPPILTGTRPGGSVTR